MKKLSHFHLEISSFWKAKNVYNLKTIQLFDPIFFPGVISSPQLSITIEKPPKWPKKPDILYIIKMCKYDI